MAKWQAALIGCGSIGSLHAQCVQQLDAIEMVAYCDVDAGRAQKTLDTYGGRYATADVDQILADDALQVVYICTQHDTHADFCIRAAQAGKHVLVEKPLALTVEACQAVGRAVADSGITLMTAFKMRYYDLVQKVHELIPQPSLVTMQMMDNRLNGGNPYFQTIRGVFVEGTPAFEYSRIFTKTHIQISVQDPNVVVGYFRPRYIPTGRS